MVSSRANGDHCSGKAVSFSCLRQNFWQGRFSIRPRDGCNSIIVIDYFGIGGAIAFPFADRPIESNAFDTLENARLPCNRRKRERIDGNDCCPVKNSTITRARRGAWQCIRQLFGYLEPVRAVIANIAGIPG